MKNLKELILRTADRHALDVSLQAAEIIAEALLAEIAKENEPFGWWHEGETEEESDFHLGESGAGEDCPTCLPLYTFPPSTEQIENRVAELEAENKRLLAANRDCVDHFDAIQDDLNKAKAAHAAMLNKIQSGGVLVVLTRPEGYEDVHPELVAEDAIKDGWLYDIITTEATR